MLTMFAVPGIGHRIKSRNNPDLRVELVKEYVLKHFPSHKLLDYAIAVETVTTSKKDNLILNVDGCIAVCFGKFKIPLEFLLSSLGPVVNDNI